MEGVTTMILIPMATEVVDIPLIAGGGICDGRSVVAALALGADGVNIGTRFINTRECIAHENVKQRIIDSTEAETVLVLQSLKNPARVLHNPWAAKILEMESKGSSLEELAPLISGNVSLTGWMEGKSDEALYPCGQVIGRIKDVPSVSELMERIVSEATEVKAKLDKVI
jgi:NAD(P)H-dependent flavin oxidoreductase YrpB (nitropropane dioxygenase family)